MKIGKSGIARSMCRTAVTIALLMGLLQSGYATELTGSFTGGLGASNNIARSSGVSIDETMAVLGGDLAYIEDGVKFSADVLVNANYVAYLDNTFDDEVLGGAAATAEYFFIEEAFSWLFQYNWGQQVFDPLRPVSPGNRENVSYLTTGPTLTIPVGERWFLGGTATYSTVTYETRDNDNERHNADVEFGRYMSTQSSIALVGSTERVMFEDDALNPDYDQDELFLRFMTDRGRNSISLDVGYSEVTFTDSEEAGDGLIFQLDWTRTISEFSTLVLGGGTRYSDQGDIFRIRQVGNPNFGDTEDVIGVASPFQNDFVNASYSLIKPRNSFDIFVTWSDEAYLDTPEADRRLMRGGISYSRSLSRKITGTLGYDRSIREFLSTGREDTDQSLLISVGYEFNPAVTASVDLTYFERDSNDASDGFDETRIFLIFNYIPKWGR